MDSIATFEKNFAKFLSPPNTGRTQALPPTWSHSAHCGECDHIGGVLRVWIFMFFAFSKLEKFVEKNAV